MDSPDSFADALLRRVRDFAKNRNIGRYALARRAGLSASALQRIDDPSWRPRSDTLTKLEQFMAKAEAEPETSEAA
jgi:predicted transcriptional regulator